MSHPAYIAETHPDKAAYVMMESGEVVTYAELNHRSNQVAHICRQHDIQSGHNVSVFMENRVEFPQIIWGAQRSGLVFTTISTHLKVNELAYILMDSQSRAVFTSKRLVPLVQQAIDSTPALADLIVFDVDDGWQSKLESMLVTAIADQCSGRELLYSSGTTGKPKGVAVEFKDTDIDSMLPALHGMKKIFGFDSNSVYLSPAPLYHAAPLRFVMLTMFEGGTAVILGKFDAAKALEAIERYRVTHSQWVPIMFQRILDLDEASRLNWDVSSMRVAIHAAAPCPVEVKQQMIDWWGEIVYEYYGSTEAIGLTVINPQEWKLKPGSVGRAVIGKLRIVDEDTSKLCGTGNVGSVYFADGPSVAYHNAPDKTEEARNELGWYTCGDVGYVDEDDYLYLSDRRDFMIISGGVNIYPQETENTLQLHPDVADAAVFGIPNREFGQEVKAVVQLHIHAGTTEEKSQALIDFCRQHLSAIKCPKTVDFREKLPRMENGKLYKKQLVAEYQ